MTAPLLDVREISKSYGSTRALHALSFAVYPGEMFGLLGPNGAGKTTTMSILAGLSPASSGEVLLAGQRVTPDNREARRQIGVVPQELAVYGSLTAAENLQFFGELYGLGGARLRRRVAEVLEAVGLADRARQKVQTFSGGMKRRLNLGAALVHEPTLLLLDEPTVGVDPQSRAHIFEGVKQLNQNGLTVIYTSHYMEEVEALCQRVGIIDQGRLQACDTLTHLLRLLRGLIRFRVSMLPHELRRRIGELPDCLLREGINSTPRNEAGEAFVRKGDLAQLPLTTERAGSVFREVEPLGANLTPPGPDSSNLELECADVKGSLLRLVSLLNEAQVELLHLETQEPNLERVFLHLTGRTLRD